MAALFVVVVVMHFAVLHASDEDVSLDRYQALPRLDTAACATAPQCDKDTKFRTIDGSCSNLEHPAWGRSNSPYIRTRKANYRDEKSEIRVGVDGSPLPKVRPLSAALFPDKNVPDDIHTLNLMQFGQVIAHDVTHIVNRRAADGKGIPCCTTDNQLLPTTPDVCLPIEVPTTDSFYSQFKVTCLDYGRAATATNGVCSGSAIQQVNINTHVLDASFVYGSDKTTADSLRSPSGDKLKVQEITGRPFPPQNPNPTAACINPPNEQVCFVAGDDRSNLNTGITLYQIVLLRLHNILCDRLNKINPGWVGDRLYQEVRKIIGALIQHFTYKHFLPIILGKDFMYKKWLPADDCYDCCKNYYDPNVNPSTYNEFSGAIFRTFHSLIPREHFVYKTENEPHEQILMEDHMLQPTVTTQDGMLDGLLRGMVKESQQSQDEYFTVGITNFLIKGNKAFGRDLESMDLQRGRDLGLPTYVMMRQTCGFKKAENFDDLADVMSKESIEKLKSLYKNVNDIDLFTGAVMEELRPGTLVGPLTQCVVGEQFYLYHRGDRFYYENCGLSTSFTKDQRIAIYKTSIAWVFCEGGDNIQAIQQDTFRKPSNDNPVVSCDKITSLDLSPWKE